MNAKDLMEAVPGLSYRKLDYWCENGVFGGEQREPGSGEHRRFEPVDLDIAKVVDAFSASLASLGLRGNVWLYRQIADDVRSGHAEIVLAMSPGVSLHIDIEEILCPTI